MPSAPAATAPAPKAAPAAGVAPGHPAPGAPLPSSGATRMDDFDAFRKSVAQKLK
jgi:hypothetical protein